MQTIGFSCAKPVDHKALMSAIFEAITTSCKQVVADSGQKNCIQALVCRLLEITTFTRCLHCVYKVFLGPSIPPGMLNRTNRTTRQGNPPSGPFLGVRTLLAKLLEWSGVWEIRLGAINLTTRFLPYVSGGLLLRLSRKIQKATK